MPRFWSDEVRRLTPYVPGEQPREDELVKLNTNENPYAPSPRALAVLAGDVGPSLRLYPDPDSAALKDAIARASGLARANVFVGNGSDEVLALCFLAFFTRAGVRFPDVSYSFYPVYSRLFDIETRRIPLTGDFRIDLTDYRSGPGDIIFPNPNAPTGIALDRREIEQLLRDEPDRLVVVDEAYVDFGAETAAALVPRCDNVLVVQTLSKSHSLAGLRVGYALGQPDLVTGLDRVKNSFNSYPIDRLAEQVAVAALEDDAYFRSCRDRVVATRARTTTRLEALGFEVLPSSANFVFAHHPDRPARQLFEQLRERGILVRYFDQPRIDGHLRITIGTDEQMEALLAALSELLPEP
jgi:histidinol-phosphate aminotransferase